jgi:CRP/FNR family cyclic AMP-dependent transcriptional regulator
MLRATTRKGFGMADDVKVLRDLPLFSEMSNKDLRKLLEISKQVKHNEGELVVEEDHSAIGFHVILEGEAEASIAGSAVAKLGPGAYFGEMSLLDGKPRSASVKALTSLRTIVIPSWNFNQMLDKNPQMMRALLIELCRRLRKVEGARG